MLVKKITKSTIVDKFDLIISSSDPKSSHLLAEKLIKLNSDITKRWIQYWGDPFAGDINKNTIVPTKFIKKEEKKLIDLCDKVIYVSPFTLEEQKENYPDCKNKMEFLPIPYVKEKIYKEVKNSKVTLGYFGDYKSKDRNIKPLYKAIEKEKGFYLNICGNSDLSLLQKENMIIKPRQKLDVVEKLEENCDILVCICNKKGTQIPGKVYHYAATNKPILIILDGDKKEELRKYFESFNRYVLCENTESEIINAINNIRNSNIGYKPLESLSAKKIAEKFIQ